MCAWVCAWLYTQPLGKQCIKTNSILNVLGIFWGLNVYTCYPYITNNNSSRCPEANQIYTSIWFRSVHLKYCGYIHVWHLAWNRATDLEPNVKYELLVAEIGSAKEAWQLSNIHRKFVAATRKAARGRAKRWPHDNPHWQLKRNQSKRKQLNTQLLSEPQDFLLCSLRASNSEVWEHP